MKRKSKGSEKPGEAKPTLDMLDTLDFRHGEPTWEQLVGNVDSTHPIPARKKEAQLKGAAQGLHILAIAITNKSWPRESIFDEFWDSFAKRLVRAIEENDPEFFCLLAEAMKDRSQRQDRLSIKDALAWVFEVSKRDDQKPNSSTLKARAKKQCAMDRLHGRQYSEEDLKREINSIPEPNWPRLFRELGIQDKIELDRGGRPKKT
jgi:hypothetical protein